MPASYLLFHPLWPYFSFLLQINFITYHTFVNQLKVIITMILHTFFLYLEKVERAYSKEQGGSKLKLLHQLVVQVNRKIYIAF